MIFLEKSPASIGGYTLKPNCWDGLREIQSDASMDDLVQITRTLAAATKFIDFAAISRAQKSGDYSDREFFDLNGSPTPIVRNAAKAAAKLGLLIDHPLYLPAWSQWGQKALALIDHAEGPENKSREDLSLDD